MKKINYKEKGITLVALVITIIILLILAGVTISTALGQNGLFQRAKIAGEKYKESEEQEQSKLDDVVKEIDKIEKPNIEIDYNDYIGAYVKGYETQSKSITISKETSGIEDKYFSTREIDDKGNQTFQTENLNWRIWSYDGKILKLISDRPTTKKLSLSNATGYNNGIYAINEICKTCYGQYDEAGQLKDDIKVFNLKRSDIEDIITYDYTQFTREDINKKYGEEKNYTSNYNYPKMWGQFDKNWSYLYKNGKVENDSDKMGITWEKDNNYKNISGFDVGNNSTQFKLSYWEKDFGNTIIEEDWKNKEYYYLLFGDEEKFEKSYWLASRACFLGTENCGFVIQLVDALNDKSEVSGHTLYGSNGIPNILDYSLRPMVSINLDLSGYKLEKNVNEEKSFNLLKK